MRGPATLPKRTGGNQRRYGGDVLRCVAVIRVARAAGVPVAEIGEALDSLPEGRTPTRADWTLLPRAWRDRLDRRIARLAALRDGLNYCIGCGCLSIDRCGLLNPDDRLAHEGPGARRLPA